MSLHSLRVSKDYAFSRHDSRYKCGLTTFTKIKLLIIVVLHIEYHHEIFFSSQPYKLFELSIQIILTKCNMHWGVRLLQGGSKQ